MIALDHTTSGAAAAAGVDSKEMLGHPSIVLTADTYTNVLSGRADRSEEDRHPAVARRRHRARHQPPPRQGPGPPPAARPTWRTGPAATLAHRPSEGHTPSGSRARPLG
ncbi:hypothetical protein E1298_18695 [Actinomadura rubrisoli]|uniref:Uncharacterized protein n=1 Tax=Actinomadura rubrisoli TaxID=2530368 RepID=A0A4V2YWH2_9ACTN|nr:hypothetical protein E1298_18695 [Actinomadura rubrisoli]